MGGATVIPTYMLHLDDWNEILLGSFMREMFCIVKKKWWIKTIIIEYQY